jgi:hypothetical protein
MTDWKTAPPERRRELHPCPLVRAWQCDGCHVDKCAQLCARYERKDTANAQ